MFKTKDQATAWALEQFDNYGIRQPNSFTKQEIINACPEVPSWAVTEHVEKRNIQLLDEDDGYHD